MLLWNDAYWSIDAVVDRIKLENPPDTPAA
jgi:hypothetical protein